MKVLSLIAGCAAADVTLVDFAGDSSTAHTFKELNDPVMGGQSIGTWNVTNGVGVFDGEVKNVPSLKAPGFIKASADGKFADCSANIDGSLVLEVRSPTADYKGFKVAFASGSLSPAYSCAGGAGLPFSGGCFKADFQFPATNATSSEDFVDISIPFNKFSDHWSSASGEPTKTCAEDKKACPTADKLKKIQRIELWAEGVDGKIHLEAKSIKCSA